MIGVHDKKVLSRFSGRVRSVYRVETVRRTREAVFETTKLLPTFVEPRKFRFRGGFAPVGTGWFGFRFLASSRILLLKILRIRNGSCVVNLVLQLYTVILARFPLIFLIFPRPEELWGLCWINRRWCHSKGKLGKDF